MGFIFYIIVLIFSVVIHEVSHGYMAKSLGDDTAEAAGRLTLNPLRHIDPFGSVIFPLLMYISGLGAIGWARPVPYNPRKLYKDFKYGPLKVALVGPLSNISLGIFFALLVRLISSFGNPQLVSLLGFVAIINFELAVFNLLPIPPLDGSKILPLILPYRWGIYTERIGFLGIFVILLCMSFLSPFIIHAVNALFSLFAGFSFF